MLTIIKLTVDVNHQSGWAKALVLECQAQNLKADGQSGYKASLLCFISLVNSNDLVSKTSLECRVHEEASRGWGDEARLAGWWNSRRVRLKPRRTHGPPSLPSLPHPPVPWVFLRPLCSSPPTRPCQIRDMSQDDPSWNKFMPAVHATIALVGQCPCDTHYHVWHFLQCGELDTVTAFLAPDTCWQNQEQRSGSQVMWTLTPGFAYLAGGDLKDIS